MKFNGYKKGGHTPIPILEKKFIIDGYSVGDCFLEGVLFEIDFSDESNLKVKLYDPSQELYFSKLNKSMWIDLVHKYAESIVKHGDEVDVSDEIKNKYGIDAAGIEPE